MCSICYDTVNLNCTATSENEFPENDDESKIRKKDTKTLKANPLNSIQLYKSHELKLLQQNLKIRIVNRTIESVNSIGLFEQSQVENHLKLSIRTKIDAENKSLRKLTLLAWRCIETKKSWWPQNSYYFILSRFHQAQTWGLMPVANKLFVFVNCNYKQTKK